MCLKRGTVKAITRGRRSGVGWKVFNIHDRYVNTMVRPQYFGDTGYRFNKWYRSKEGPGFHIFKTKKDAHRWKLYSEQLVYKVEYRGATHTGKQQSYYGLLDCILADGIMILKEGHE